MTHPEFRAKLTAIGFGVFIPVFFVTSGCGSTSTRCSRALTVLTCRSSSPRCSSSAACRRCSTAAWSGAARSTVAALLQATSLPFIVAATRSGWTSA